MTPGYGDEVIFADGTFIDGSTAELSADGPIRPPYVVYCQVGEGESVCCVLCSSGGVAGVLPLAYHAATQAGGSFAAGWHALDALGVCAGVGGCGDAGG